MSVNSEKTNPKALSCIPAMGRQRRVSRTLVIGLVLCSVVAAVLTCAPAVMVNVWHDPSIQAPRLSKLLVIAVRTDPIQRRLWEDAFAAELAAHGVTVTQSYRLDPNAPPDTSQIRSALETNGFSGVLVAHPLPPQTENYYVHGYYEPQPVFGFAPWGRYYNYWYYAHRPGYVESVTTQPQQIDLYMAESGGGRLVWSATTEVRESDYGEDLRHDIVTKVVPELSKQGMIPPKK